MFSPWFEGLSVAHWKYTSCLGGLLGTYWGFSYCLVELSSGTDDNCLNIHVLCTEKVKSY